jgi:hypothetical protein
MRFTLCSLGFRHSMHAMLRLESKRGTSEQWSGVGGWMLGRRSQKFANVEASTLCRVGDKVASILCRCRRGGATLVEG